MVGNIVRNLQAYQSDCVNAFRMECSPSDIRINPEAKKLAKYINRQSKIVDRIVCLYDKIM